MKSVVDTSPTYWFAGGLLPGTEIWTLGDPIVTRHLSTEGLYIHGNIHREDGPAATFPGGNEFWFYRNQHLITNDMVTRLRPLSMDEQDFVFRVRPDLANQLLYVFPELRAKYQHELELAGVDL